ncbi:MAG: OmpA family protein [Saprospiraceae bacterium]|nr:OmpA family protein [Saprospiraceae bacterium]
MRSIIVTLGLMFWVGFSFAQNLKEKNIYFDSGRSELKQKAQNTLDELKASLESYDDYTLKIQGHTDFIGSNAYNEDLAKRRSDQVHKYLVEELGITEDQIEVNSFGEMQPVADNHTVNGRSQNRRVSIQIIPVEKEEPISGTTDDIRAFLNSLVKNKVQHFRVPTKKDTFVLGAAGTVLHIPQGAFANLDPKITHVDFALKEVYNKSDMILHTLSTNAGEDMLETGGMLHLEASHAGQKLVLNPNKKIGIMMPVDDLKEDMQLFNGRDRTDGSWTEWELAENNWGNVESKQVNLSDLMNNEVTPPNWGDQPLPVELQDPTFVGGGGRYFTYMVNNYMPDCNNDLPKPQYKQVDAETCKFFWCKISKAFSPKYRKRLAGERAAYLASINRENTAIYEAWLEKKIKQDNNCLSREQWIEQLKNQFNVQDEEAVFEILEQQRRAAYEQNLMRKYGTTDPAVVSQMQADAAQAQNNINYLMSTKKMGWVNCDRFYDSKQPLMAQNAKSEEYKMASMMTALAFKDINSVMAGQANGNKTRFGGVPEGKKAWLVAIKMENGSPLLAMEQIKVSTKIENLEFKKYSAAGFKKALRKVDL